MKTPHRFSFSAVVVAVVMACAFSAPCLAAIGGPTSKLYVSDLKGKADLNTRDAITPLSKKAVFDAQGSTILTANESNDSMVYSNGTGIYLDGNTRLSVKKFIQEPFTPNRYDLETEPSVSQTEAHLSYGVIGLCTSRLAAGSNMVYTTPQAIIDIRGNKIVIEVGNYETRVSVLDGDVTIHAASGDAGEILHGGQEAIIRADATDHSTIVHAGPIPDDRKKFLDDRVSLACIAKRTVYFEVVNRPGPNGEETQDIQAAAVVPADKPVDFTVSPSALKQ
ncbi:MAG TPA: FecR domain-containing protein [Opitutaceae bacterium]|nr:FecR domain-containing protein [Opitutaceae bacterium]